MKKTFFVLLMCAAIATTSEAGMENEPDGFRGIKFGAELSEHPDIVNCTPRSELKDGKSCERKGDKLQIGDAPLSIISYMFWQNKFEGVMILAEGKTNFRSLFETLKSTYGVPERPNQYLEEYQWNGDKVVVFCNAARKGASIGYVYLPMMREQSKMRKEAAEKGKDDL